MKTAPHGRKTRSTISNRIDSKTVSKQVQATRIAATNGKYTRPKKVKPTKKSRSTVDTELLNDHSTEIKTELIELPETKPCKSRQRKPSLTSKKRKFSTVAADSVKTSKNKSIPTHYTPLPNNCDVRVLIIPIEASCINPMRAKNPSVLSPRRIVRIKKSFLQHSSNGIHSNDAANSIQKSEKKGRLPAKKPKNEEDPEQLEFHLNEPQSPLSDVPISHTKHLYNSGRNLR